MDEYIKKQDLVDWCNETYKKQTNIKGKEYVNAFLRAVIIAPVADVVPKSEADNLIEVIDNTTQQFLELHYLYQNTKSELSGKYEDLKLKYADLQKDYDELIAWGGHIKSTERAEIEEAVARAIFEKIETVIGEKYNRFVFKNQPYDSDEETEAIINYSDSVSDGITELKKKYTEGAAADGDKQ